jgi:FkbM family methyltransferase
LKKILKLIIKFFAKILIQFLVKFNAGRYFIDEISNFVFQNKKIIEHKDLKLCFYVPNRLNFFRVDTFSSKEPETLKWIDTFKKQNVFWDIGANIGLYSCYAAKQIGCQVYAFEPSVFNLELLAKNIDLNLLSEKITIIPTPLYDSLAIESFHMSTEERGGALSNFGENINQEGNPLASVFKYKTVGISIDQAISNLGLQKPNYIKMDVDGIEHLILKGANNALKNAESILLEVNDNYEKQTTEIKEYLNKADFSLKEKKHSKIIDQSSKFSSFYNQLWVKKN